MGGFYGSVQIKTEDRDAVRTVLVNLSRKEKFLIGPPLNGWVGIYPEGSGQDFELVSDIAKRTPSEIMATLVHHDDIFAYEYYREGVCIDRYNSTPDYFNDITEEEKQALRGNPERFAHLAKDPARFTLLAKRLSDATDQRGFPAFELLEEFAKVLGIRNAVTSYEYLKEDEETEGIVGWKRFIHVPDLSDEKASKRSANTALANEKKRLIRDGLLFAERGGLKGWASPYPFLCQSPNGRGFLVCWSNHLDPTGVQRAVEYHGPPWPDGPTDTPWKIGPRITSTELSPSGRYLAAPHYDRNSTIAVWDLIENRLVTETPEIRGVKVIGFPSDESATIAFSYLEKRGRIITTAIDTGNSESTSISIPYLEMAAIHPSGSWLVASDSFGRLHIIDTKTGKVARTHYVGGIRAPTDLELSIMSSWSNYKLEEMEPEIEEWVQKTQRGRRKAGLPSDTDSGEEADQLADKFRRIVSGMIQAKSSPGQSTNQRGTESVFRFLFEANGNRCVLGTSRGLRVYSWYAMLDAVGDQLRPVLSFDLLANYTNYAAIQPEGCVYDVAHDSARDRFLFAGFDGCVRYLDAATERSGIILEVPGKPLIREIALSRDNTCLALKTDPDSQVRSLEKRRGCFLQFWNYEMICEAF